MKLQMALIEQLSGKKRAKQAKHMQESNGGYGG
jgi:hypothetical protein